MHPSIHYRELSNVGGIGSGHTPFSLGEESARADNHSLTLNSVTDYVCCSRMDPIGHHIDFVPWSCRVKEFLHWLFAFSRASLSSDV